MERSMQKYAAKIESGQMQAHVVCPKGTRGMVFDPDDENTPLDVIGFGLYALSSEPVHIETGEREYVLIPQDGTFRVEIEGEDTFEGSREGGHFACPPGTSNASAVYVPRESRFSMTGDGEMLLFSAPSSRRMKPVYIPPGEVKPVSRGSAFWRRDVITLVTPGETSTNIVAGETYSPPGLWSGTPLHVHDKDAPEEGQSDHEEVYYHVMRLKEKDIIGPYGVQLLFDGKRLNKAYIVTDRSAVAIPGGAHPVIAAPVTDHIYAWGLAGKEGPLGMWDLPEFAYLKEVGRIVDELNEKRGTFTVEKSELDEMAENLPPIGRTVLELVLRELGYRW